MYSFESKQNGFTQKQKWMNFQLCMTYLGSFHQCITIQMLFTFLLKNSRTFKCVTKPMSHNFVMKKTNLFWLFLSKMSTFLIELAPLAIEAAKEGRQWRHLFLNGHFSKLFSKMIRDLWKWHQTTFIRTLWMNKKWH